MCLAVLDCVQLMLVFICVCVCVQKQLVPGCVRNAAWCVCVCYTCCDTAESEHTHTLKMSKIDAFFPLNAVSEEH